jgi:hypothetical protein
MTMTLDNQQWSGGDWGRGISQLQITQKHHHSQCHQGNNVWGIQLLLRDASCDSWKWVGRDRGRGIYILLIAMMHRHTQHHQGN